MKKEPKQPQLDPVDRIFEFTLAEFVILLLISSVLGWLCGMGLVEVLTMWGVL